MFITTELVVLIQILFLEKMLVVTLQEVITQQMETMLYRVTL